MAAIREQRCVPAKRGMFVWVDGRYGQITGARGGYIMVRFWDARFSVPCHPRWRVDYLTDKGVVRTDDYPAKGVALVR